MNLSRLFFAWVCLCVFPGVTILCLADDKPDYDDTPGSVFDNSTETQPAPHTTPGQIADHPDPSDTGLVGTKRAMWQQFWPNYAARYVEFEDVYYVFPDFDARYPSSKRMTLDQYIQENTRELRITLNGMGRTLRLVPTRDDATAGVNTLPNLTVGEYGHIHSVKVEKILGPDEALVSDLWLIDSVTIDNQVRLDRLAAQQASDRADIDQILENRYRERQNIAKQQADSAFPGRNVMRMVGFPTRQMTEGQRWLGFKGDGDIQIAVIASQKLEELANRGNKLAESIKPNSRGLGSYSYSARRNDSTPMVVVLAPLDALRNRPKEAGFIELLKRRNLTPAEFVDLVVDTAKAGGEDVEARVLAELEKRVDNTWKPDVVKETSGNANPPVSTEEHRRHKRNTVK
ncbi:MAG: hypothetical protein GC164_07250 [Phycisphaera sp.]|nr:hypothetical protein [Phycisphaera sp.]